MEKNKILYFEQLDSTNAKAKELALSGASNGTVIVAKQQTAGRGRKGRQWTSPSGNVYMSVLLRPQIETQQAPMLTLVMAYSVAKVMERCGYADVAIKWPNDLLLSDKKVGGILTEMHMDGREISHVVIGVGINVNAKAFPMDLEDKATSLFLESGKTEDCTAIVNEIAEQFQTEYEIFLATGDVSFLQEEYNRLLINRGKEVRILEPGNEYTAHAIGINDAGELIVRTSDNREVCIFAGEVSVRGIDGYI